MKSPWVQDLTSFFENLGKSNLMSSAKLKINSNDIKCNTVFEDNNLFEREKQSKSPELCKLSPTRNINNVEHCCKVKEAREMFERLSSSGNTQKNLVLKPISSPSAIGGSPPQSSVSSTTKDKDAEKGRKNSGVMSVVPVNMSAPSAVVVRSSSSDRRKRCSKTPSSKRSSNNYKYSTTETDVAKESDGVIVRMKSQESYYDCRDKYRSLLPDGPLCQLLGSKRVRRSVVTQRSMDGAAGIAEGSDIDEPVFLDSVLCHEEQMFPEIDQVDSVLYLNTSDSDELEPTGDCESNGDMRLSQYISGGPQRIKWADTEEGQKIIRIKSLTVDMIKWQEAQFEVITSEASYYKSLEILVNKIYKSPLMVCQGEKKQESSVTDGSVPPIMTALQKHHLFSNILEVHICSGELLKTLETRWRENPFIEDLSDIIIMFCKEKLKPYVTYLRNQRYQTSTYNQLLTNPNFEEVVRILEADHECGWMNLSSFLLLPMQRLLRLKLLFTVIRHYIPPRWPTAGCDAALASLETLIKDCSDQKTLMEQKEEIMKICGRLVFKYQTGVSIGNQPLLKDGEVRISPANNKASKLLTSSFVMRTNSKAQMYLFEDQLIIAKTRSNDDREMVADICPRSDVKLESCDNSRSLFFAKHYSFRLILLKGLKGRAEYECETDSKEDFDEWQAVFSPSGNEERDQFEFNEVLVSKDYQSLTSKELDLKRGQILTITRRINDGMAMAISGEKQGLIPLSHVHFVMAPASNCRLMQEIRHSIASKRIN